MSSTTVESQQLNDLEYSTNEAITSWLSTSGSQIFFMQLGFLCYEVGFVNNVWAPSIILKNIEDTFVGILTYLAFSHTLATSSPSFYGIISYPNNPFLIGIDASQHEEVFVASVFATTCATIISGAVLERMKNKTYILWCFLIILVNYSFISHWIWNKEGWLSKLGYVDGAGAVVVHSTGGVAGLIAVWRLGPRRGSINKDGTLKPIETAHRPIINAIGAFILWYGWFAFNVSSPIAGNLNIGSAVGTTAIVTCIAPTCASCSALLLMYWDFAVLSYDNLLGALLSGLVGITGACFTVNIWEAATIGFFSSVIYFLSQYIVRQKLKLDDPLQVISIHLCCGLYSCIMEGIFANNVMNNPGLVYNGYKHLGIQIFGTLIVFIFNIITGILLWYFILEKGIFRNTTIRVSILDTYLGVSLFELNNTMALEEVLLNKSNLAKQMSWQFHNYTVERFNNEQFDFLIAINIFRDLIHFEKNNPMKIANSIISIVETYILPDAIMCVNLSGTQRARLIKIKNQLQFELAQLEIRSSIKNKIGIIGNEMPEKIDIPTLVDDHSIQNKNNQFHSRRSQKRTSSLLNQDLMSEKVFDHAQSEVFKIVLPVFSQFLQRFDKKRDTVKENVRLPFRLLIDWMLEWDHELIKDDHRDNSKKGTSLSKAASRHSNDNSLLGKQINLHSVHKNSNNIITHSSPNLITHSQQLELVNPSIEITQPSSNTAAAAVITPNTITTQSPAFIIHAPFASNSKVVEELEEEEQQQQQQDQDQQQQPEKEKKTEPDDNITIIVDE